MVCAKAKPDLRSAIKALLSEMGRIAAAVTATKPIKKTGFWRSKRSAGDQMPSPARKTRARIIDSSPLTVKQVLTIAADFSPEVGRNLISP